jgi:hypothetical protein
MLHRWEERWEHLQLILEVYQFARDAAVAEAWLIAQDPYLKSEELGVSWHFLLVLNLLSFCSFNISFKLDITYSANSIIFVAEDKIFVLLILIGSRVNQLL